ncbi:MAG: cytochrome b/b6 domain-containing protein [Bdellovibrionales bacterium]|nr:cytochrome b/b6 domain-containing protein [Bdellovibrionales bacterium]
MRSSLIYDGPTRVFHWLFASLFLFSFTIAKTVDDESAVFTYHMLSGLLLGGLVFWRLAWGVLGSKYARFSEFSLKPRELKDYFAGILSNSKKRWAGHNPASSWAALAMFAFALGLATTGYLMTTGNKETYEDLHEFLANGFVITACLHVAGVIFHSLRHQDAIALSMVDGKKVAFKDMESITSPRPFAGLFLVVLILSASLFLYKKFDTENGTLQVFGQTLQLGEHDDD